MAGGQGKNQASTTPLSLSPEAQQVVAEFFASFPPTENELLGKERIVEPCSTVPRPQSHQNSTLHNSAPMRPAEIANRASVMASRLRKMPALQQVLSRAPFAFARGRHLYLMPHPGNVYIIVRSLSVLWRISGQFAVTGHGILMILVSVPRHMSGEN